MSCDRLTSLNCSKGQVAKQEDLKKAFGTIDTAEIVKQILEKGELQVGGKEREAEIESTRKEIATGVAERCVDPTTQRPHTVTMIEKALSEIHFNVLPNKSTKSQVSNRRQQPYSRNAQAYPPGPGRDKAATRSRDDTNPTSAYAYTSHDAFERWEATEGQDHRKDRDCRRGRLV